MTFQLAINTDNAAFDGGMRDVEIARILKKLALRLETIGGNPDGEKVRDSNGNSVGEYRFTDD